MKKIVPILVVFALVASGLGATAITLEKTENTKQITLTFSTPMIEENINNAFLTVRSDDITTYLKNPGQPLLPKMATTIELDFGVTNIQIDVIPTGVYEQEIPGRICPAPKPIPLMDHDILTDIDIIDEQLYTTNSVFPEEFYSCHPGSGLNADGKHVTFVPIHIYPYRYNPVKNKLIIATGARVTISYDLPQNPIHFGDNFDLVIIAPRKFSSALQPLVDHKNDYGMKTMFKPVQEIYNDYNGFDKPEEIKLFIKDVIENEGIKYVLLVGGLKHYLLANDRENDNEGTKAWHVPIRYSNLYDSPNGPNMTYDPGHLCDLYYADIYKAGNEFDDWDSNDDGIFASKNRQGIPNDVLDLYPDVAVGRLACRNRFEVKVMVDKIIAYESTHADPSWFNKTILVGGDGFQDQEDLDILWDTDGLPNGDYTIFAQTKNDDEEFGPIDVVNVTINKDIASVITFSEEDHLKIDTYPFAPIAEITVPSEDNILGNTNINKDPPKKAYIGTRWTRLEYINGVMHIKGKAYDPQPHYEPQYASETVIKVWVNNSNGETVFGPVEKQSKTWFEGEAETQKGSEYLPESFTEDILWTSTGELTSQQDVIDAISEGSGFLFFAGHGNPNVWANHNPGIPGGRGNSSVYGLKGVNHHKKPLLPMYHLTNAEKLPICVVGGCHNSQFNVSILKTLLGKDIAGYWTHGAPIPECWSWWLTRKIDGGAIATIGMTALGYGALGDSNHDGIPDCIQAYGGWINSKFFEKYGVSGHEFLGDAHEQTITSYITEFGRGYWVDAKTVQAWALLGDPSLMIGGYDS